MHPITPGSPLWCPDSITVATDTSAVAWTKDVPHSEGLCPYLQAPLDGNFNPAGHEYVTKFYWNGAICSLFWYMRFNSETPTGESQNLFATLTVRTYVWNVPNWALH